MAKESDKKKVISKRIKNNKFAKKKKGNKKEHPIFHQELTFGQRASDKISAFGGSWTFIGIFVLLLFGWIWLNSWLLFKKPYDPYPYILLNLILSCLAALQAPVILMAQNRQAERDRVDAKYDHAVNRKAEREIQRILKELRRVKDHMREIRNEVSPIKKSENKKNLNQTSRLKKLKNI